MRIKFIFIIISLVLIFTGCKININSQEKQANLILDKLVVALDNKDTFAVKEMFAEEVQNTFEIPIEDYQRINYQVKIFENWYLYSLNDNELEY